MSKRMVPSPQIEWTCEHCKNSMFKAPDEAPVHWLVRRRGTNANDEHFCSSSCVAEFDRERL